MPRVGASIQRDGMVETGHEATTPQRTGGQRQRSGEWSTLSGANSAHRQAHCRRARRGILRPAGAAERGTWRGAGSSGARQARRAEETSTPQEDVDILRGPGHSDDGLADDIRQRSHPGLVAYGVVVSTPREVGTCSGEVGAWALRVA